MVKLKKLAIITTCLDDWGGSEYLWSRTLDVMDMNNVDQITIIKNTISKNHPEFLKLKKHPVVFQEIAPNRVFLKKIRYKSTDLLKRIGYSLGINDYQWNKDVDSVNKILSSNIPDLVIISQGINFDGLAYAYQCIELQIPYIIICQKAVDFFWPQVQDRAYMKETLLKAKHCFFVSKHNLNLTEEQFGIRLPNSAVIFNPIKCDISPLPFPSTADGIRLACVGRYFVIDKGQDILLRVLSHDKWRQRNIHVSFYGSGPDKDGLIELANLLAIKQVSFLNHENDVNEIWKNHHALILPSRSEGLPLAVIEAMALGRLVITTNQGGSKEIIEHKITGYIADATEKDLDETMEHAYHQLENWERIGKLASAEIARRIPESPEIHFAKIITRILNEQ